jgi:tetratricopeptide (TPR) repeat protein
MAQLSLAVCYGRLAPLLDNKTKIGYSKLVKSCAETSLALDSSNDLTYYLLGSWNYEMANLNPILRAVAQLIYGQMPSASNDDAVKFFKKAIALNSQRAASHVDLGRTYIAMGKNDLAKEELNKGLALPNREKDDPDVKQRARDALKKL